MIQATTLYRPVGQAEMDFIRASRCREFPPRLLNANIVGEIEIVSEFHGVVR